MPAFVVSLWHQIVLSSPLFVLLALGYALVRFGKWPSTITDGLTRFVFSLALPAMLFRMMCDFSERPAVDARLLIAFWQLSGGVYHWAGYRQTGVSSGWRFWLSLCPRWDLFQ